MTPESVLPTAPAPRPRLVDRATCVPTLYAVAAVLILGLACGGAADEAPANPEVAPAPAPAGDVEATSLLGEPLERTELPADTQAAFEQNLAEAEAQLAENPDSADALIWVGRRTAYLGRYREAIDVFSRGVEQFPDDPRFLRHRGHRYITTRQIDRAVDDLAKAYAMIQGSEDEVEPDGMPNAQGVPTSTLHSNIRYHLALGHVLRGEFEQALPLYQEDVDKAGNPDMRTASSYWLYLTLRRLGRDEEARAVVADLPPFEDLIENFDYHRLLQAFANAGQFEDGDDGPDTLDLSGATVGYGLATFDLVEGREQEAYAEYRRILEEPQWAAFGYIAAEAELARAQAGSEAAGE